MMWLLAIKNIYGACIMPDESKNVRARPINSYILEIREKI